MQVESLLREIPSVEKLATSSLLGEWRDRLSHRLRVKFAREIIEEARRVARESDTVPKIDDLAGSLRARCEGLAEGRMRKVLNATGVILHTNLGRAPLGGAVLAEMAAELDGYTNLELDLETGSRGKRGAQVERWLCCLTGAEAALVVNNNAAALFLALHTLSHGRSAIVSRGELVQIGGGFRVPDIMQAAGTALIEVGTTNMTAAADYERALAAQPGLVALVLKIHQSNFMQIGHVASVEPAALARVAAPFGVPLLIDLGSGAMEPGLGDEPDVIAALSAGAGLVCFSGDKLLGGPQAGIIVGNKALVDRLRQAPLYRALRMGKLDLFVLERVLWGYLAGRQTPTTVMAHISEDDMEKRARRFSEKIAPGYPRAHLVRGASTLGGGSGAGNEIPTVLVNLGASDPEGLAVRLLHGEPAVVPRREKGAVLLDLRTITAGEEDLLATLLMAAIVPEGQVCSS